MSLSMYAASSPVFVKMFKNMLAWLDKAEAHAKAFAAQRLEGSDKRDIVIPIGLDRTMNMKGEAFVESFSIPNFFFHVTMVYAILRQGGVEIGKGDYLGGL